MHTHWCEIRPTKNKKILMSGHPITTQLKIRSSKSERIAE
jgi:hypothetical protein